METTGYMNRANHALTASSSSVTDVLASLDMPRNRLAAHQHIVAGVSPEVVIKLVALLGSDTRRGLKPNRTKTYAKAIF